MEPKKRITLPDDLIAEENQCTVGAGAARNYVRRRNDEVWIDSDVHSHPRNYVQARDPLVDPRRGDVLTYANGSAQGLERHVLHARVGPTVATSRVEWSSKAGGRGTTCGLGAWRAWARKLGSGLKVRRKGDA